MASINYSYMLAMSSSRRYARVQILLLLVSARLIGRTDAIFPLEGCEREYTLLLQDIARHYLNCMHPPANPSPQQTLSGAAVVRSLPVGVSLILSVPMNPFRHALASLASSIAAGNAVILGTESSRSRFFTVLTEKARYYLDSQAIHILSGLDLQDPIFSEVDHVFILDIHPHRYSAILSSPTAVFHSIESGCNLAVVDNGRSKTDDVTKIIYCSFVLTPSGVPERLTAVFIRHGDLQPFRKSFSAAFRDQSQSLSPESKKLMELGLVPFVGDTYQAELSHLLSPIQPKPTLSFAVEAARRGGLLLVLLYTSFEQVMDGISTIKPPPLQIALLAPASQLNVTYFEKWTRCKVFSVGTIRSVIAPATPLSLQVSQNLFSSAIFSQSCLRVSGKEPEIPSITAITRQNESLVKAPPPDPNKTVDFFVYMTRVLVGIGITLGSLGVAGAWVGYKRALGRHS